MKLTPNVLTTKTYIVVFHSLSLLKKNLNTNNFQPNCLNLNNRNNGNIMK